MEGTVNEKLCEFVKDFVGIYEASLAGYAERLESRIGKPGKTADLFGRIFALGKKQYEEADFTGMRATVTLSALQSIVSGVGVVHNRHELRKLTHQLYLYKKSPAFLREQLVRAGVEVFGAFERQFVCVAVDGCWQRALAKLAEDAAVRAIDHFRTSAEEFGADSIARGVLAGKSKVYRHVLGIQLHRGRTVRHRSGEKWNTAKVFEKTGLVVNARGTLQYYKKPDGDARKYGHRLLLPCENQPAAVERSEEHENYTYNIKQTQQLHTTLLNEINAQDTKLLEARLGKHFAEIRACIADEIVNALETFIASNYDDLLREIEARSVEIVKGLARDVGAHFAEMRENFERIEKGIKELGDRLDGGGAGDLKQIWFEVKKPTKHFTGRKEQLEEIGAYIGREIICINGLPGTGKSNLVFKYANDHSDDYGCNVVAIDAETPETLCNSFRRLGVVLDVRCAHDDEHLLESLVYDVYERMSKRERCLYVFDNVQRFDEVERYLPLRLPVVPHVIIVARNVLQLHEHQVRNIQLGDFSEAEGEEFVRGVVGADAEDVGELVRRLHNFPLALEHAAQCIRAKNEELRRRGRKFTVRDFIGKLEDVGYESYYATLKLMLDMVAKENAKSLEMLGVMAYFASNNIPEEIFENELALGADAHYPITDLLERYSIVRFGEEGMLSVHGLVQELRRRDLERAGEEETILHTALRLLKKYMLDREKAEGVMPHIISIWNYAIKYPSLVDEYIVNDTATDKYTTYFHLIAGCSSREVVDAVLARINHQETLARVINARNGENGAPLHNAALNGDAAVITLLLTNGADVNATKNNQWTPLLLAARKNHPTAVESLLTHPHIDVNAKTTQHNTALHFAAKNNNARITALLLARDADANARTHHHYTPLHHAATNGNNTIVQALLAKTARVDAQTLEHFTPLHDAARNGRADTAALLLTYNADVNALTKGWFTPLHFAAKCGHLDVVNVLLLNNADASIETTKGNTALFFANKLPQDYAHKQTIIDALSDNTLRLCD